MQIGEFLVSKISNVVNNISSNKFNIRCIAYALNLIASDIVKIKSVN
ncbi:4762_t:CDS:2 [Scutellospora calospora]|uniref:4762_t:CDS:1 n=1 Tax=Scutellospora calospora TaxID=85575 RepID=A0ACA9KF54_9GLOM|nr:4762_t:CDS:2 [Scutellospora calospora]